MMTRDQLKWNGWGIASKQYPIDNHPNLLPFLQEQLRLTRFPNTPSVSIDTIDLPPTRLGQSPFPITLKTTPFERITHACGKSYTDLVQLRTNTVTHFPDGVLYPQNSEAIAAVLKTADRHRIGVIPFAGGSSVVGGVNVPELDDTYRGVITMDLCHLNRLLHLDMESQMIAVEPGIYGPHLENTLNQSGLILGHYPQSFEFSTVGGWVAARSAGHQSNRYGKIEDMIMGFDLVTPGTVIQQIPLPAHAVGPDLNQIVAGSEGTLGVITKVWLRCHHAPASRKYFGILFKDFSTALHAIQYLVQEGVAFSTIRLSDRFETRAFSALSSKEDSFFTTIIKRLMQLRGYTEQSVLGIWGFEGSARYVAVQERLLRSLMDRFSHQILGTRVGREWLSGRFELPYLRDPLLDRGLLLETFETATTWHNIMSLYTDIRKTVSACLGDRPYYLMAHVSHVYHTGASLYFTLITTQDPLAPIHQWRVVKKSILNTISRSKATVSHHHGIGVDHKPFAHYEKSPGGMALLRAIKVELDPNHIMNPDKVVDLKID